MKKYIKILVSLFVIVCIGFFIAKKLIDKSYGAPDIENGKKLYTANCVACHGEKGLGDGVASSSMSVSPDSIYEELKNPLGFKPELVNSVLSGDNGQGGVMPAFEGILSKEDIYDIFGYILSVNSDE